MKKKKQKSLLKITVNREPRATKQSIISNTIENRSIPPATTIIMTHSNILRQRSSPKRILFFPNQPPSLQILPRRRRWSRPIPTRENEQEKREEECVDEDERGSERFEKRNYTVAGSRR